jgi:signal transduction histidine kinase
VARRRRTRPRFRPLAHIGLRARITLAFSLGALVVSLLLIVASAILIRQNLLTQRERLVSERVAVNAALVADKVGLPEIDAQTVFGSLSTAGKPSVVLRDPSTRSDVFISVDTAYGAATLPAALRSEVLNDHRTAMMRYERGGELLLAVGAPIPDRPGAYFEVNLLDDIDKSLSSLFIPLVTIAAVTCAFGATLGWWASRRVLRPLADITDVAEAVAKGRLDSRVAYSEWADDTDLAPLVSTFNDMVAALQDRIDRDARFASDVSHELRSPLTTFNASLQVLANAREEMPERAQLALDLLTSDMTRFTQLVEDLLEISRFDAGAVRLELDQVMVVETVQMAARTLSVAPLPVEAAEELQGVIITCDKRRLVRVLANYIDNAAKYAGGASRIVVERAEHPDPGDPDGEQHLWIRIAVDDTGPGVPEGERSRIFDRFNRGALGGSRGSDLGVGLGLALAAEHARLQGGTVWVESRPDGSGARFVLELPFVESDPAEEWGEDELRLDEVMVGPTQSESREHTGTHDVVVVPAPEEER